MGVDYKLIGNRIKAERKKQNMTQEKLAEKLGVSVGYISQVERGITKTSLDLLGTISDILCCDISDFIKASSQNSKDYMSDEFLQSYSRLRPHERRIVDRLIQFFLEE